jgi:hypothetical protein
MPSVYRSSVGSDERMIRRLFLALVIALAIAAAIFRLTHTPIYGECHDTPDGRMCTLIGYKG